MDDHNRMVQRGYKPLPGPERHEKIYYRLIGDNYNTHVAIKTAKSKAIIFELSELKETNHWLAKALSEAGEL